MSSALTSLGPPLMAYGSKYESSPEKKKKKKGPNGYPLGGSVEAALQSHDWLSLPLPIGQFILSASLPSLGREWLKVQTL